MNLLSIVTVVSIGERKVGDGCPCLISLEPGATYTNIDEAKFLTKATADAGAEAIKFQTFVTNDCDRMMGIKDLTVDFTTTTGKKQELYYDAIKRRELSNQEWIELSNYAKELGLLFITAPYFPETIDLLFKMEVDAIKISKGDVNNVLLVEQAAKTKLPIILDAREKIDDVIRDIEICTSNNNDQIIIMHCPSGYPSEYSGVHLNAISSIKEKFHYPVGFADHSPGMLMNFAAVSIGANMLEVTITSDKTIEHAEHFMSLEPHELKPFVENIRKIENAMGDPDIINSSRVADSTRRHFIAKHDISQGDTITRENIDYQRPGNMGISVSDGLKIINKFAKIDIKKGSVLTWDMLD